MRLRRKLDPDRRPDVHVARYKDNGHDTCFADQAAGFVVIEHRGHQTGLEFIQLRTRVAQAGYLDHRSFTQMQARPARQRQQVETARRDVLTHLASADFEADRAQLVVQLGLDQVDLPQIGLLWLARLARKMLDRTAEMRITLYAQAAQELDPILGRFTERVRRASADGDDRRIGAVHRAQSCLLASRAPSTREPSLAQPISG
jgi:hypothetical protein